MPPAGLSFITRDELTEGQVHFNQTIFSGPVIAGYKAVHAGGEITEMKSVLKAYIREAIEVERAGLKVKLRKTSDLKFPDELQTMLDEFPDFKTAFAALTPGRQRAYIFHISAAKQSKTRESRILKCMPQILKGKGLLDE